MSSSPPRMSAPLEGPVSPKPSGNPTTIVFVIVGSLLAVCCLGGILLLPAFRIAASRARNARQDGLCVSNLHAISRSITLYEADNDGELPQAKAWMDQIRSTLPADRMLHCPLVRSLNRASYGYAYNKEIGGKKATDLDSKLPAVFDSTLLTRNAASTLKTSPHPPRHIQGSTRVNNGVNLNGSLMIWLK